MSSGGNGQILGTIVGAVAGYFTGGASYVALGASLGGAVGSLLDPKQKTETNRLDDIKVSISKYGDGIPETWGNNVPPATWIWSTYVIQIPQKQSGGKGGGTENTNYLQFIYGTLCFGRSPPPGSTVTLRKLWIDGKLNYDGSTGLSVSQALANAENPFQQLIIRDGNADQLPWALTETWEGIGNVPAHRGRITGEIFGLQVPGGRIPQIAVELCVDAGSQYVNQTISSFPVSYLASVACIDDISAITMLYGPGWTNTYDKYEVQVRRLSPGGSYFVQSSFTASNTEVPARGHSDEPCFVNLALGGNDRLDYYTADGLAATYTFPVSVYSAFGVFAKLGGRFVVGFDNSLVAKGPYFFDTPTAVARSMGIDTMVADVALTASFIYVMHAGKINRYSVIDFSFVSEVCVVPNFAVSESMMNVVSDTEIYVFDHVPDKVFQVTDGVLEERFLCPGFSKRYGAVFHVVGDVLIYGNGGGSTAIDRVDSCQTGLAPAAASVAAIMESQSLRSGLSPDQFDVTTIDDEVWGLTFKTPASARSNIAPLMTYAAIGVVEEDGLLRYFHRADKSSIDTVPYDELGAAEDGSEPGDPFPLVRSNAQEFPRSITLTYNDKNFDYQQSTVKAMRYAVEAGADESQVLDIAMDGNAAASIAHRLLYERWLSQTTRSFKVSRKYAYWSAGDVVTFLKKDGTSYGAFMLSKLTDTGATIEGECFPADGDLAIQTVPGTTGFRAQQIEPIAPPTRLVIADSAILRDEDSNAGVYAVMAGMFSGWTGAELFAGDDEASLASRGSVAGEAAIGYAETLLGSYALGNVDENNLLTVNVGGAELSSITRDLLLSGALNVALLGVHGRWEVIKFQRANALGSGRYILSGLLRGQNGTEWAAGLHQTGDTFLLMGTAGTLRPNFDTGSIGQTKAYKAVTFNRSYNSAAIQTEENTGEGLKPLSPTTLRKAFSGSDIVLAWGRRTRLSQQWWLGMVPLGEEVERYVVEIYESISFTTVKRTLTSTTPTVTYTSADQIADFGSNQTTVHARVYQVSGTVGLGHELQQSI